MINVASGVYSLTGLETLLRSSDIIMSANPGSYIVAGSEAWA
jgi:hypothetical protein